MQFKKINRSTALVCKEHDRQHYRRSTAFSALESIYSVRGFQTRKGNRKRSWNLVGPIQYMYSVLLVKYFHEQIKAMIDIN